MTKPPLRSRPCRACRARTKNRSRLCIRCRSPRVPPVQALGGAVHVGTLTLSREAAIALADLIIDSIERQERQENG